MNHFIFLFFLFFRSIMLLNLAIEDKELLIKPKKLNVTKVTSNLKRGSWKKRRMDAKKIVQRLKKGVNNECKIQAKVTIPSEPIQQDEFKRKTQKGQVRADAAKAGFTSSIFTSNPIVDVSKTKIETAIAPDSLPTANVFSDCTFARLGIHPVLTAHLEKLKVTAPTSIQRQSIPKLVSCLDKDMIIQAQTGSGKTFSFLLPILNQLITASAQLTDKYGNDFFSRATGTLACILVPTRELAQQISAVLDSLLRYTRNVPESKFCKHWIVSGILVGGESKKSEKARIRKGINILVATPGRLLDHLKTTESFDVGNLRWLVLDEADNLLHLGFEETLIEILRIVNEKGNSATQEEKRPCIDGWPFQRQTILCSATIEGGVEKLAQESLREPVFIKVHDENPKTSTKTIDETTKNVDIAIPSQLEQFYLISPAKLRLVSLVGLIRKITQDGQKNCKIMIFLSTGDSVDWHFDSFVRISESPERENEEKIELDSDAEKRPLLYGDLQKLRVGYQSEVLPNCRVFKLHGSLLQSERHAVFTGFSPDTISSTSILFCTDVAARILYG
jgi:ATP-dependent RNA helicase DDX31/DBP7